MAPGHRGTGAPGHRGTGVELRRWIREFKEYRPWTSQAQFEREIGKYVRANPKEVTRLWRYVVIR